MIRKSAVIILVLVGLSSLLLWMLPRNEVITWSVYKNRQRAPRHNMRVGDWEIQVSCRSRSFEFDYVRSMSGYQARPTVNKYGPWAGFMYIAAAIPDHRVQVLDMRALLVPFWCVALLFLTYPTTAFIRGALRRYRRRRKGLCLKCGYNLTGNVTGVCSECGEKI